MSKVKRSKYQNLDGEINNLRGEMEKAFLREGGVTEEILQISRKLDEKILEHFISKWDS